MRCAQPGGIAYRHIADNKGTTKIERHHKFAKHLAFGGDGLFRTNDLADLAFLSPYPTSKLKRFGDYPTNLIPEAMPITTTLPM
jgi:hypothetical protein